MLKKWIRHSEMGPGGSESLTAPPTAMATSAALKMERGRQKAMLYGLGAKENESLRGVEVAVKESRQQDPAVAPLSQADFEFWQSETLDPKTGRTTDSKILHNIAGERNSLVILLVELVEVCSLIVPHVRFSTNCDSWLIDWLIDFSLLFYFVSFLFRLFRYRMLFFVFHRRG